MQSNHNQAYMSDSSSEEEDLEPPHEDLFAWPSFLHEDTDSEIEISRSPSPDYYPISDTDSSTDSDTELSSKSVSPSESPTELSGNTQSDSVHPVPNVTTSDLWCGFKLVGDNIDKNVRPRYMRGDHQSQSLHYFHCVAVKDRIDLSQVSNACSFINHDEMKLEVLLPSHEDYENLQKNITVLISRLLVQHIPFFKEGRSSVTQHIEHQYSVEMAEKSKVVS